MPKVCIIDASTLKYEWADESHTLLKTLTSDDQVLAIIPAAGMSQSQAIFESLDEAQDTGRVYREGAYMPVCIYNPLTAELSLGRASAGQVFSGPDTAILESLGSVATLSGDAPSRVVSLQVEEKYTDSQGFEHSVSKIQEFYENPPLTIEAAASKFFNRAR